MNLDDYIVSEDAATRAAAGPGPDSPSQPEMKAAASEEKLGHSVSSAIPIKSRKESAQKAHGAHFVPQSVPVPAHHQNAQDEFGYVNRHHRKTSIDDRRVSIIISEALSPRRARRFVRIFLRLPLVHIPAFSALRP